MSVVDAVTAAPIAFLAGAVVGYKLHDHYMIVRVRDSEPDDEVSQQRGRPEK